MKRKQSRSCLKLIFGELYAWQWGCHHSLQLQCYGMATYAQAARIADTKQVMQTKPWHATLLSSLLP
jgi:hypothetical protein